MDEPIPSCLVTPRCLLSKTCRTTQIDGRPFTAVSPGFGIKSSYRYFFIGEAPGAVEDDRGLPFVGDAGQKLSQLIRESGIDQSEVWLTNSTRCRPPRNRPPSVQEAKACSVWLRQELEALKPEVVILLGASALRTFNLMGEGGITTIRGQVFERHFPDWEDGPLFKIVPTLHPAALLYNPSPQRHHQVVDDIALAAHLTGETISLQTYQPSYRVCETLEDVEAVVREISEVGEVALDTESRSLPYTKEPMTCVSLCWGYPGGKTAIVPFYRHDPNAEGDWKLRPQWQNGTRGKVIKALRGILENPDIPKLAWHGKYDANVLRLHLGLRLQGPMIDGMILKHLLDENPPHGLEYCADLEFRTGDYSRPLREIIGHGDKKKTYDNIPDEILYPYTATDVESTWRLCKLYWGKVSDAPELFRFYCEESLPTIGTLADMEWVGVKLDPQRLEALKSRHENELAYLKINMVAIAGMGFNPSSYPAVAQTIERMGYGNYIRDPLKASKIDVSRQALSKLEELGGEIGELAAKIKRYRTLKKLIGTYFENAIKDLDHDGRIRYSFKQHGTVSGRLSCSFFHQIPRINKIEVAGGIPSMRSMFVAEDGYVFVYGDASQVELRVLAAVTQDLELLRIFAENRDIHRETAAACLGCPPEMISDYNRSTIGKAVNFGIVYGSEGHALTKLEYEDPWTGARKPLDLDTVQTFIRNLKSSWTSVAEWMKETPYEVIADNGVVRTAFGRMRRLGRKIQDRDARIRSHAEREALNVKIQGPAASITNRTVNLIRESIEAMEDGPRYGEDVRIIMTVHDSIISEVREHFAEWYRDEVFLPIAQRQIPELLNMSFPFNVGIGRSWEEAELNSK